jgi:hypothetical protein
MGPSQGKAVGWWSLNVRKLRESQRRSSAQIIRGIRSTSSDEARAQPGTDAAASKGTDTQPKNKHILPELLMLPEHDVKNVCATRIYHGACLIAPPWKALHPATLFSRWDTTDARGYGLLFCCFSARFGLGILFGDDTANSNVSTIGRPVRDARQRGEAPREP